MLSFTQILPSWVGKFQHCKSMIPLNPKISFTQILPSWVGKFQDCKSMIPLNSEINSEKYEHPCQVENLNPVDRFHPKKPNQLTYDPSEFYLYSHGNNRCPYHLETLVSLE